MAVQVEFLLAGLTDSSGNPLSSGKVYFYDPGTTNTKTLWTDEDESATSANPVILNSAGVANVYARGRYDIKVDDSSDSEIYTWDDLDFDQSFDVDVDTGETTISNTSAETTIGTLDFDGTLLTTSSVMEFFFAAYVFNNEGTSNSVYFRVKLNDGSSTELVFYADITFSNSASATSVVHIHGFLFGDDSDNRTHISALATDADADGGSSPGSGTVDLASDSYSSLTFSGSDQLIITAEMDTADANFQVTPRNGFLRVLP